jgi:transposase
MADDPAPAPVRGHRPTKLTDESADRIVAVLRSGGYVETAAAVAGITKRTFYGWMARGDATGTKAVDAPYRAFRERVDQARAEAESRNVAIIATAAAKDWKAAAWLLERQAPERWGRPIARPDDAPHVAPSTDPLDALDAQVVELAPRRAGRKS